MFLPIIDWRHHLSVGIRAALRQTGRQHQIFVYFIFSVLTAFRQKLPGPTFFVWLPLGNCWWDRTLTSITSLSDFKPHHRCESIFPEIFCKQTGRGLGWHQRPDIQRFLSYRATAKTHRFFSSAAHIFSCAATLYTNLCFFLFFFILFFECPCSWNFFRFLVAQQLYRPVCVFFFLSFFLSWPQKPQTISLIKLDKNK